MGDWNDNKKKCIMWFGIKDGWSWEKLLLEVELQYTHVMAN